MLDAPFAVQATLLAKENDALRAENERLEMLYRTQGEALDRENDALRARCEKAEAEREVLRKQLNGIGLDRMEAAQNRDTISMLRGEIAACNDCHDKMEADRDRLAARCKELEEGLREALVIAKQSYDAFPRESADAVVFKLRQLLEGAK